MKRNNWHIVEEAGALVLARRLPVRFDLAVETTLPPVGRPRRLAHQIRQDLWRALRRLRGFSPAVRIAGTGAGLTVTAGGRVEGAVPRAEAQARIAALLEDPARRARWIRWAA